MPYPEVYLVDDDEAVLRSLKFLFVQSGWKTAAVASPQDFLREFDYSAPSCVICDYRMPGMTGIEMHRECKQRGGWQPFIMLTAYGDFPTCTAAIRDGIAEFLEKPCDGAVLVRRAGELLNDARREHSRRSKIERFAVGNDTLTRREIEVMHRLAEGRSMKEIAAEFGTSFKTVSKQRLRLLDKLGVQNDIELAKIVWQRDGSKSGEAQETSAHQETPAS